LGSLLSSTSVYHTLLLFFFQCYGDLRDLHSFPTRRSSDLEDTVHRMGERTVGEGLKSEKGKSLLKYFDFYGKTTVTALIDKELRSEEHTSELQSRENLVCRLLLEKKKKNKKSSHNHLKQQT